MRLKDKYIKLVPDHRLYKLGIPVIGLTGGIASGKSTVAEILSASGLAIVNADHLVKQIYAMPDVFNYVQKHHSEVIQDGNIQFPLLRKKVFSDPKVKTEIEGLIYQYLPQAFQKAFAKFKGPQVLIYDVPLLFERNMKSYFDLTVLVYAPKEVQKARLMTRDGHLEDMADNILNQQMDIEEKKLKADLIINNSGKETELAEEVKKFLRQTMEN